MREPSRVAVIGAGITGLSAAVALREAGVSVRCFEKGEPGQAQSIGLARIFRLAHPHPALVRLALRARAGWSAWERRYGRHRLGDEGMLVTGVEAAGQYERAMAEAGAPFEYLEGEAARALLPIGRFAQTPVFFDPGAGSIRVRRTIEALRDDLGPAVTRAEVLEIAVRGAGAAVRTAEETWACDRVLIAAGIDTPRLAAQVGIEIPGEAVQIMRFSYRARDPLPVRPLPCWIDSGSDAGQGLSAYCLPVGSTGLYAVGASGEEEGAPAGVPFDEVRRQALATARQYVTQALPGLDPEPAAEVWCSFLTVDYPGGDGFRAYHLGPVVAVYGTNLFKFAPLLGELFARAISDDALPPELEVGYLQS